MLGIGRQSKRQSIGIMWGLSRPTLAGGAVGGSMVAVAAFGLAWMHAHAGRLPIAAAWTRLRDGLRPGGGWAPRSLHLALFTLLPDPPTPPTPPPRPRWCIDAARAGVGASWANTQLVDRINTLRRGEGRRVGGVVVAAYLQRCGWFGPEIAGVERLGPPGGFNPRPHAPGLMHLGC